ncbi:hypothetical protein VA7868_00458 [Vibrio aerogenes CECT 7868]|uniref:DUF2589 domain-containing protein n=1 Tax=Vibrio aerogenes CECT 7868 TaxID=1216006 RepID=A0A1M5VNB0_9VIBR|nr:DUF2589 domain-containing protein [Vibrio aerogenes]SHH76741.1 hypothetical protein VA7868_00458 [Vibrio aerogenes CECT 7868]
MIEFQALMRAIHRGAKDAAKSVEGETIDFIRRFFDEVPADEGPDDRVPCDHCHAEEHSAPTLRPKTCAMQFPGRSADGVETVTVKVPLLALVPVSSPRITEVKFSAELEISTDHDDKLIVSFPQAKKGNLLSSKSPVHTPPKSGNAHIEITLTGHEPPDGLKKLIEGYERALRSQIPG